MSNKWETAPNSLKVLYFNTHEAFDTFSIDPELLDRVLDDYNELKAKHQKALEAISRCKDEIDDKDKLIEELKSKNKSLDFKYRLNQAFGGYVGHIDSLNEKIKALEKENKELKYTLEKDGEFGKSIGKYVVDCIRDGYDKGVYELNPYTWIDIHVEETNNMPWTFDRYAIPRISIMFNNTQTEMERDTAQHECEELHEKIDRLWSVNDELNRKIRALEKDLDDKNKLIYKLTPKKSNLVNNKVPPTGCCGCCTICTLKDICWILND